MDYALKTNANAIQAGKAKTARKQHVKASTTARATEPASVKTCANVTPAGLALHVQHPTVANSTVVTKTEFVNHQIFVNVMKATPARIVPNLSNATI